jgi:hypothetical protein
VAGAVKASKENAISKLYSQMTNARTSVKSNYEISGLVMMISSKVHARDLPGSICKTVEGIKP